MLTLIIDGNNLAHRAKHVFNLSNNGKSVSVTYGFLHTLNSYLIKFKPTSVIVCWDGGSPSFRTKSVPEYKVSRDHGDQVEYADFLRQVQELCDYAFPMMGVVSVRKIRAEADDLMYHASRIVVGNKIIITSDKDLFQALNDDTRVYNPARDKIYNVSMFEEEYGIPIEKYIDWRALIGDSSDNIPGVHGIGEKTATKLFIAYKELTNIVNAALGHYPDRDTIMSDKVKSAVLAFGFDKIVKNVYTMALYADRVGARKCVTDGILDYNPADKKRVKMYLMRQAFVSLLDGMPALLSTLAQPTLYDTASYRQPIVCEYRRPLV